MPTSPRNAGLDLLRVTGIIAVVAGHVDAAEPIRSLVYPWHVPLFFVLSGYLSRPSPTGATRARQALRDEWRSRWASLLRPYVAWLVILLALVVVVTLGQGRPVAPALVDPLLGGAYAGAPFSAFWFVTALAVASLAVRVLEAVGAPPTAVAGLGLIGLAVGTFAPGILTAAPLSLGLAIPCLFFLAAGRALRVLRGRITRPALTGGILTAAGALAVALGSRPVDLKHADFGTPVAGVLVAVGLSVGLILLAEPLGSGLPPRLGRACTALAEVGIGVVLSHAAVIWLARAATDASWVVFAAATILPFAGSVALRATRLAPVLLGLRRRSVMAATATALAAAAAAAEAEPALSPTPTPTPKPTQTPTQTQTQTPTLTPTPKPLQTETLPSDGIAARAPSEPGRQPVSDAS